MQADGGKRQRAVEPAFDIHGEILCVCSVCLLLLTHPPQPAGQPAWKGGNARCAVQAGTAHCVYFLIKSNLLRERAHGFGFLRHIIAPIRCRSSQERQDESRWLRNSANFGSASVLSKRPFHQLNASSLTFRPILISRGSPAIPRRSPALWRWEYRPTCRQALFWQTRPTRALCPIRYEAPFRQCPRSPLEYGCPATQ